MRRTLALLLLLPAGPSPAATLAELLAAVSKNDRFPEPTRADVKIERRQDDVATSGTAVFVGRGRTLYVETRDGTRALIRPSKIVVRADGRVTRAAIGARLGATDVLLEDLVPVTAGVMKVPQVSDQGPTGTVVTGAPAFPSARVLVVLTIDEEAAAVTRAKYYEKSISDLAAFRRNEELIDVAGHRRPTRVVVDRQRDGATTRLEIAWRAAPDIPRALFTLAGLRGASPIAW